VRRKEQLKLLEDQGQWDLLVIGGGASGLGVALDAVSRGMKTILAEKYDFGKGTSSKSTKLIHGGVRYLEQGNVRLVREALKERDYILEKAPHNAHLQPFIIPFFNFWMGVFYFTGLKLYDLLAGKRRIGKTKWLSKSIVAKHLPQIVKKNLKGGILYFDGQFDDARMCIDLVRTIQNEGGVCLNYLEFSKPLYKENTINGGILEDKIDGSKYTIYAKYVVNATGVFADSILKMDNPRSTKKIIPSRGSHIVLDKKFLDSEYAIMIPKTSDGRVLFVIPWNHKLIIGTTDVKSEDPVIEPQITNEEVDFILENSRKYLMLKPERSDILSVYSGLRPLAAPENDSSKTKEISRGHKILTSKSGLVSIIGGKWTTFRKMGEDVLTFIDKMHQAKFEPSRSGSITILTPDKQFYSKYPAIEFNEQLLEYLIKEEMACSIEDVLARRTRILFMDAQKARSQAPQIGKLMQKILNQNEHWFQEQLKRFNELSNRYNLQDI
jgi:glycerol-3-phosphate dehydrogenase